MPKPRRSPPPRLPLLRRYVVARFCVRRLAKQLGVQAKGSSLTGNATVGEKLSHTTNAAVAEGQADVANAKATGAGYVDQAKGLASTAISTAQVRLIIHAWWPGLLTVPIQSYLPPALGGTAPPLSTTTGTTTTGSTTGTGSVVETIKTTAAAALETGKQYAASAQAAAQPHLDRAAAAAQPHLERAGAVASDMVNVATTKGTVVGETPASSTGIPATSAPLETGGVSTSTPYPATTTTQGAGRVNAL